MSNQIGRHIKYCRGYGPRHLKKNFTVLKPCRYCGIQLEDSKIGPHATWCMSNPNRTENIAKIAKSNIGKHHTDESKKKISEAGLRSKHRRLVRSIRSYIQKNGEIIKLDSSWEEELAKRLDFLCIEWNRPKEPMEWTDSEDKIHHYFPDFYLPKFNIYLDPKNPQAICQQKEKIDFIHSHYPNVILIRTLIECKTFVPLAHQDRAAAF